MKRSLGQRVKLLREAYRLNQSDFAHPLKISYVALGNIERDVTSNPQNDTMQAIVDVYGTTHEWLKDEKGEMLPNGLVNLKSEESNVISPWKDATITTMQDRITDLKSEVAYYRDLIKTMAAGKQASFKKALGVASLVKTKSSRVPAYN